MRAAHRVCTPAHRCRHSSHRRRPTACVTSGRRAPAQQLFFGLDFGRFFDDALAAIKTVRSDAVTQVGFTRLRIDGQAGFVNPSCERCMPRLDGVLRLSERAWNQSSWATTTCVSTVRPTVQTVFEPANRPTLLRRPPVRAAASCCSHTRFLPHAAPRSAAPADLFIDESRTLMLSASTRNTSNPSGTRSAAS